MRVVVAYVIGCSALFIAERLGTNAVLCLLILLLAGVVGRRLRTRRG